MASALAVAVGLHVADPLVGLAITLVILRITLESWRTVRAGDHAHEHRERYEQDHPARRPSEPRS